MGNHFLAHQSHHPNWWIKETSGSHLLSLLHVPYVLPIVHFVRNYKKQNAITREMLFECGYSRVGASTGDLDFSLNAFANFATANWFLRILILVFPPYIPHQRVDRVHNTLSRKGNTPLVCPSGTCLRCARVCLLTFIVFSKNVEKYSGKCQPRVSVFSGISETSINIRWIYLINGFLRHPGGNLTIV